MSHFSAKFFFLIFIVKKRGSKNNITEKAGRGRCESDVKVTQKQKPRESKKGEGR